MEIRRSRIFDPRIKLGYHANIFSSPVSEFTRASELSRPTVNGNTAPGEQDSVPDWQNRQRFRYDMFLFSHVLSPKPGPQLKGPKTQRDDRLGTLDAEDRKKMCTSAIT